MNVYRNWFLASRPWSFSMTAISVSVGSALAAIYGDFSWFLYLITLGATIFLYAATNLINDYYDVQSGVDTPEVATAQYRPHPLVEGKLEAGHVRAAAYLLYGLSTLIGIYLAATRGWALMWIGLTGAIASLTYTAPPFKYKYSALGEISVFLMWGPLMVAGSYFVQRQEFNIDAFPRSRRTSPSGEMASVSAIPAPRPSGAAPSSLGNSSHDRTKKRYSGKRRANASPFISRGGANSARAGPLA